MITLRFEAPSDLLDAYFDHGRLGGLFVAVQLETAGIGDDVPLEVIFTDGMSFRIRSRVAWRRVAPSPGLPPGVGLEFLPTEKRARDLLLDHAQGRKIPFRPRGAPRLPLALRVKFRTPAGPLDALTEDVSEVGLFVRTRLSVPKDTTVALSLRQPGRLMGLGLRATVVRRVPGFGGGLGLRFEFRSDRERSRLRSLLERASGAHGPETAPSVPATST